MAKTRTVGQEAFAVRNGESVTLQNARPDEGRFIAVMARTMLGFPDGEAHEKRRTDGAPVENAVICAAQLRDGEWRWMALAPLTKEFFGDLLCEIGAERDTWYYVTFTDGKS